MTQPPYIICMFWEHRTRWLKTVQVFCSKCSKLLSIEEKNTPRGYIPICALCVMNLGEELEFGGFAIGGKIYRSQREATQAIENIRRRN